MCLATSPVMSPPGLPALGSGFVVDISSSPFGRVAVSIFRRLSNLAGILMSCCLPGSPLDSGAH